MRDAGHLGSHGQFLEWTARSSPLSFPLQYRSTRIRSPRRSSPRRATQRLPRRTVGRQRQETTDGTPMEGNRSPHPCLAEACGSQARSAAAAQSLRWADDSDLGSAKASTTHPTRSDQLPVAAPSHGNQQRVVLREQVTNLGKPIRVIWGEKDSIIPASHAALAGAEVHTLPNAGHMEAANEVNKLLQF